MHSFIGHDLELVLSSISDLCNESCVLTEFFGRLREVGGQLSAVLICCWLLKLLQTLPPFSHSVILKSLVCRIKSLASKRDVVLLSFDGDLYKSPVHHAFRSPLANGGAI